MNQYIINGDEIYTLLTGKKSDGEVLAYWEKDELIAKIHARPYKSEREKVLDYLDEWINQGENLTLFKWEVREVVRELRQAGE